VNYFEQELSRLAQMCGGIGKPTFTGRVCYGNLGGDNRIKLQFVTTGYADHYDALKATVLNRTDGVVDTLLIRFSDIWGKKQVINPNFPNGLVPHIWTCDGKSEWYVYRPTEADFRQLAGEVSGYIDVFADRSQIAEKTGRQASEKGSVVERIHAARQNPAPQKDKQGRGKTDQEL